MQQLVSLSAGLFDVNGGERKPDGITKTATSYDTFFNIKEFESFIQKNFLILSQRLFKNR